MYVSCVALTLEEIELVKKSFKIIQPMSEDISRAFYERLFKIMPAAEIFKNTDIAVQTRKFAQTLDILIGSLDRLEVFSAQLEQLGTYHQQYGVRKEHFIASQEALMWALEHTVSPHYFTPEVANAWAKAYETIVDIATRQY